MRSIARALSWSPNTISYYTETATEIHKLQDEILVRLYDSFLKQPYGVWLLEHIWMIAGWYALVALLMLANLLQRD